MAVPRRLLVVKVHGMGDSVLIRSLVEHFRRRDPPCKIGVLAGPATRDVLTMGSNFDLHGYHQGTLGLAAIARSFRAIRACHYEAALNFEQGSMAGTAFIRALGIPVHAGFVPLSSDHKAAMLTHPPRFREADSMWESFTRLVRLADADFPARAAAVPLPVGAIAHAWAPAGSASSPAPAARGSSRCISDAGRAGPIGAGRSIDLPRWPIGCVRGGPIFS